MKAYDFISDDRFLYFISDQYILPSSNNINNNNSNNINSDNIFGLVLEKGSDVFIRHNEAIPILQKVLIKKEESFSKIISSRKKSIIHPKKRPHCPLSYNNTNQFVYTHSK